jgi:hypothetical protein
VKRSTAFRNPDEATYGGTQELFEYRWVGVGSIGEETPVLSKIIKENEANATLIAAAPDLLEALQLILNDNRLMNALSKQQARAVLDAVAKATGGVS